MEEITYNDGAAFHFLTHAITGKIKEVLPSYENHKLEVEFKVNGIELPFQETLKQIYELSNAEIDRMVADRVMEILKLSGLDSIREAIENAEYQIKQKITEATGIKF